MKNNNQKPLEPKTQENNKIIINHSTNVKNSTYFIFDINYNNIIYGGLHYED
jgi:hypothetical protein